MAKEEKSDNIAICKEILTRAEKLGSIVMSEELLGGREGAVSRTPVFYREDEASESHTRNP